MFSTELVFIIAFSYLIGSIPTGFLIVRWAHGIDLRREGTGNVGAMNSFEVTGRRRIGLTVAALDFLKGLAAFSLGLLVGGESVIAGGVSACAVVIGHDFSPWIGFRGGRGLSPAAGALALFSPLCIVTWGLAWIGAFCAIKDIGKANYLSLALLAVVSLIAPPLWWWPASGWRDWTNATASMYLSSMIAVILIAHFRGPVRGDTSREA